MRYSVAVRRRSQKQIARLPGDMQTRIEEHLWSLADDPRPPGCRKLRGREGWRTRVGDYRVIYEIDDEVREVLVVDIGHRRDVYR